MKLDHLFWGPHRGQHGWLASRISIARLRADQVFQFHVFGKWRIFDLLCVFALFIIQYEAPQTLSCSYAERVGMASADSESCLFRTPWELLPSSGHLRMLDGRTTDSHNVCTGRPSTCALR